jgi:hypothetical protein
MLRVALTSLALASGTSGCLWEPILEQPDAGNLDAAPVIQQIIPPSTEIFLSTVGGDSCVARVGLPTVISPRAVPLQASFYLNANPPGANLQPLSINGQTKFDLQAAPGTPQLYSLSPQPIAIDEFSSQFNGHTNLLQVVVSDNLDLCPNPWSLVRSTGSSSSDGQPLECYATSWAWVIEPNECSILLNGI